MWRSFFLACGVSVLLLGLECLVVDNFILAARYSSASNLLAGGDSARGGSRDVNPPDWAPWSLLSAGAVTMLYSFTIPQRVKG